MGLLVIGINHNTASVAIREKVAFDVDSMAQILPAVVEQTSLEEVAILSTCNRTELYCIFPGKESPVNEMINWLGTYHRIDAKDLQPCSYAHCDEPAIRHMAKVASGLDSMILGEPQVFGQIKSAYATAQDAGTVAAELGRVFQHTFLLAKRIRTETAIGQNPVSVAYAAVSLAQQIFTDLRTSHALLIGAGKTIELVARHLRDNGVEKMTVANRTLPRAQELAGKVAAKSILLADIPAQLHEADIVISSTGSQLPILGKGAVETALKTRKHRPMFMVDIAVPRDIEEQVSELDDVYLYSVDDLREVIDESLKNRQEAAREADAIIEIGVQNYRQEIRELGAVSTLKAYRSQAEQLRDREVQRALQLLNKGEIPEQVIKQLARSLTNKLLHAPSVQMKKATAEGRTEILDLAQELFDLQDQPGE